MGGDGDRFLAFLGTLNLLAAVAEEAPALVVVDDAHWLDDAATAALLFTARRLQAERVALLFAAREGDARRFEAPDLPSVDLGAVTGTDAEQLLRTGSDATIDCGVRDRLVAATGGNPLALVELAGVLTAEQLAGTAPLPSPLPLTGGVERAFLDRYARLSRQAQQLLLVASADDTGRVTVVRHAADLLRVDDGALDEVERAGLLTVSGDQLALYHPLVRSAVYGASTSSGRRAVHRALADALHEDADRRAWHLAAATDRPDDQVVDELEAVAQRAAGRGGHEAAAAAGPARPSSPPGRGPGAPSLPRRLVRLAGCAPVTGRGPGQRRRAAHRGTMTAGRAADPAGAGRRGTPGRSTTGTTYIVQAAQDGRRRRRELARRLAMLAASLSAFGGESARASTLRHTGARPDGCRRPVPRGVLAMRGFVAGARRTDPRAAREFTCAFELTNDTRSRATTCCSPTWHRDGAHRRRQAGCGCTSSNSRPPVAPAP